MGFFCHAEGCASGAVAECTACNAGVCHDHMDEHSCRESVRREWEGRLGRAAEMWREASPEHEAEMRDALLAVAREAH